MNRPLVCLVIDDDPDDQEIFELAIKDVKTPVACVFIDNCADALTRLDKEGFAPDYIFLDLNMPKMDGKDCLVEIKKMAHLEKIPVIIYSTSSAPGDIKNAIDLGATDYLIKPREISLLTNSLAGFFYKYG